MIMLTARVFSPTDRRRSLELSERIDAKSHSRITDAAEKTAGGTSRDE
ncbi:hypothetical protein ABIC03_001976 [Bradyrhizobium sp. RT6a]